MSNPKWTRIDNLSPTDIEKLDVITSNTKGFTRYGHRARAAVMLPLSLAELVSEHAQEKEISVGQAIIELLEKAHRR